MIVGCCALALHSSAARAQVELPGSNLEDAVAIAADEGSRWTEGVYEVWWLRGNCLINQGLTYARAREAVLWIERGGPGGEPPHKVIAYLEGDVSIDYQQGADGKVQNSGAITARLTDKTWIGRLYSTRTPTVRVTTLSPPPAAQPDVYPRALAARSPDLPGLVKRAQFIESPAPAAAPPTVLPAPGQRRILVTGRSAVRPQLKAFRNDATNEWVFVITQGVNVIVDGLQGFGSVDLEADNVVIWTQGLENADLSGQTLQPENMPLQIYMEGNIVFRQGERIVQANRMFYDVQRRSGIVLGAEILTPVPEYHGLLRLRADVVQQLDEAHFAAQNASLTSSRLGIPTYELVAENLSFTDIQQPVINPATGQQAVDPITGEPVVLHERLATSTDNYLYLETFPVFYWPVLATDLERPSFYLNSIRFKQDRVFGTQIYTDFNAYELFGIRNPPEGTDWNLSLDYLSERGPAAGTNFVYNRVRELGGPLGPRDGYYGFIDAWGIHDDGLDNLGRDRRALVPEEEWRGRLIARHRQFMPGNYQLSAELGLISDRNFLEQFFENEWDQGKDATTGVELKQLQDNTSWAIWAEARPNDFFTDTEWLPRLDHFWLGQPLFDDTFTWYEHTSIGYARLQPADPPEDPGELARFDRFPWEADVEGERVITRQEIDWPFSAGAVKVVPYALGELGHWGELLDGEDGQRAYGQVGVRASLPMWAADPTIESQLLNLHGLAHKVVYEADISYADANRDLSEFPLYDQLDDNSIEAFRRRFRVDTFGLPMGTPIPERFDERFYALRRGLGGVVTSPSMEIADDLTTARLGVYQRWQTKRGAPGMRRIVDWIVLDTEAVIFPDADDDNFGESLGLIDYNFRWHVGDRLTLVSDGFFEMFEDGPRYVSFGAHLNRPPRGSLFLGVHSLEGPISSTVLAASFAYRMSPKWISTFGTSYDLSDSGNIGQELAITRIGESFLVTLGFSVDASRGNVGASFLVEPRFLARGRFGPGAGIVIPPAGAFGLE